MTLAVDATTSPICWKLKPIQTFPKLDFTALGTKTCIVFGQGLTWTFDVGRWCYVLDLLETVDWDDGQRRRSSSSLLEIVNSSQKVLLLSAQAFFHSDDVTRIFNFSFQALCMKFQNAFLNGDFLYTTLFISKQV